MSRSVLRYFRKPSKVEGVKGYCTEDGIIKLEWNINRNAKHGYVIGVFSNNELIKRNTTVHQYILADPKPDTRYTFWVKARNEYGNGNKSDLCIVHSGPRQVQNITYKAVEGKYFIVWDDLPGNESVYYNVRVICGIDEVLTGTTDSKYECIGACTNTEITVEIHGVVNGLHGKKKASTFVLKGPGQIKNPVATAKDAQIILNWDQLQHFEGTYKIEKKRSSNQWSILGSCGENQFIVSDIQTSTKYIFRIRGENKWGTGEHATFEPVITGPKKVTGVIAKKANGNITAEWQPVVDKYSIRYKVAAVCDNGRTTSDWIENTIWKFENPLPATHYHFEVIANNGYNSGVGACSRKIFTDPSAPRNIKIERCRRDISVTWDGNKDGGIATYRLVVMKCQQEEEVISTRISAHRFDNLIKSTEYSFKVCAVINEQYSKYTESETIFIAPTQVRNVVAGVWEDKICITWEEDKEDEVEYRIKTFKNGKPRGEVTVRDHSPYRMAYQSKSSTYKFKVWARNKHKIDGEHSISNNVAIDDNGNGDPTLPDNPLVANTSEDGNPANSRTAVTTGGNESRECVVCRDRRIDTTFVPCGHLYCCEECSNSLNHCPICRVRIDGKIKTYSSS
uniref:titin-like n=1 Tax=Styela clava TaxID=7725 RepID=UPI00193A4FEE|nr:titin-like [Styela clava]